MGDLNLSPQNNSQNLFPTLTFLLANAHNAFKDAILDSLGRNPDVAYSNIVAWSLSGPRPWAFLLTISVLLVYYVHYVSTRWGKDRLGHP